MADPLLKFDNLFDSILSKVENKLAVSLTVFFRKLSHDISVAWKAQGEVGAVAAIHQSKFELIPLLQGNYITSGVAGGGLAMTMINFDLREDEEEEDLNEEVLLALLLVWATQQAEIVAEQLTVTTIEAFEEILATNIEEGLIDVDIIKDTVEELSKRNRGRVRTIATTEAGSAVSVGQERAAEIVQIQLKKSWRSQADLRVRDSHARANSRYSQNPIAIGLLFMVGASAGKFPRDSMLSMAEKVNCRCYSLIKRVR